jgi:hypothetical protein
MNGIYDVPSGPLDGGRPHPEAERLFRAAVTIRVTLLGSVGVFVLMAFLLRSVLQMEEATPAALDMMVLPLAVLSVMSALGAVFLVPHIVPIGPSNTAQESVNDSADTPKRSSVASRMATRSIMAAAFATPPALYGFILAVMGVSLVVFLGFVGVTAVSSLLTFPRWSEWEEAGALATVRIPTTR